VKAAEKYKMDGTVRLKFHILSLSTKGLLVFWQQKPEAWLSEKNDPYLRVSHLFEGDSPVY